VFAVYPGRAILGTAGIPVVDPGGIPPGTRLTTMGSPTDLVVGETPAREMVKSATAISPELRDYVRVRDPEIGDHYARLRSSKSVRITVWRVLDDLIAEVQ
jgi:hypothetical protein